MPSSLAAKPPQNSVRRSSIVFPTQLGWMALQTDADRLISLSFEHLDRRAAVAAVAGEASPSSRLTALQRDLQQRLTAYAAGEPVDFGDIVTVSRATTSFAARVEQVCRDIPYGETLSYAQVAAIAGSPGAARAVGNVMSSNPVPLVIPCHRVVGANGSLGGYSARGGLEVKRKLLALESHAQRP